MTPVSAAALPHTSCHYEGAWLDCVAAMEVGSGFLPRPWARL